MSWYAIRTVYLFDKKLSGVNVFEERVVCFEARSWEEAHKKAEVEADAYAAENGLIAHPEQIGYEQDGAQLVDGYELWSELFEAPMTLEAFYTRRYAVFAYNPEDV